MKVNFYKKINDNRIVVGYTNGKYRISETNGKELSYLFDYIGEFKYDDDLKDKFALAKINLGQNLRKKDTLMFFINNDGKVISYIYSLYYDKIFETKNLEKLIDKLNYELYCESKNEDKRENEGINKIKLLVKIEKKRTCNNERKYDIIKKENE